MNEAQALEFIHSIERFGSKPGLRRVTMLLERMGNPQDKLRFIHVAGTNGKGSTCTMLSYILSRAGYRTGLYISPFVLDFRERIQVNNQMISQEDLAACTAVVKAHWDALDAIGEPPTEFEVVVAIAMEYFVRQGCDVVVLEVGMGGRFDATNVIGTPLCSVITSIAIDHVQYLGDTIEQIAYEKAGIIKQGGVTVSYPEQDLVALSVIMEQCAAMDNKLLMGNPGSAQVLSSDITGSRFQYGGEEYYVPLAGPHQVLNAITVLETVRAVTAAELSVSTEAVQQGMAATRFPSRLEILCEDPLVLLDGAHNLSGAQALGSSLDLLKGRNIHVVMGMLADKDIEGVLAEIMPRCRSVIAVSPHVPRAMAAVQFAERVRPFCSDVYPVEDHEAAVREALDKCNGDDVVLLCGSLYLASQLRPIALKLSKKP